jgi:hypothetical protein
VVPKAVWNAKLGLTDQTQPAGAPHCAKETPPTPSRGQS